MHSSPNSTINSEYSSLTAAYVQMIGAIAVEAQTAAHHTKPVLQFCLSNGTTFPYQLEWWHKLVPQTLSWFGKRCSACKLPVKPYEMLTTERYNNYNRTTLYVVATRQSGPTGQNAPPGGAEVVIILLPKLNFTLPGFSVSKKTDWLDCRHICWNEKKIAWPLVLMPSLRILPLLQHPVLKQMYSMMLSKLSYRTVWDLFG